MAETTPIIATGRRKTSVAQVRYFAPGEGKIVINSKPIDQFFGGLDRHKNSVTAPLRVAEVEGKCDLTIKVVGGGVTGQAEAIRHGVARAVGQLDEKIRKAMRREGFLTRDDRMVERKKPGRPKARRRFQYSKR
jgi:small subunit ribosomal protein S9